MNPFTSGDLVLWKGIEMKVISVDGDSVSAATLDEGMSTRVWDSCESFAYLNPPPPASTVTDISPVM